MKRVYIQYEYTDSWGHKCKGITELTNHDRFMIKQFLLANFDKDKELKLLDENGKVTEHVTIEDLFNEPINKENGKP
jgi:hypothetical protein